MYNNVSTEKEKLTVLGENEIKQGSYEWLEWRKKGIGSSDVAAIMNKSPYKTKYQLWLEKTGQVEPEDLSGNFIVQRGTALEPEARDHFSRMMGKDFKPYLFIKSEFEWARYSCDGFNGKNEIIEIKCPGDKTHNMAIEGNIPAYLTTRY